MELKLQTKMINSFYMILYFCKHRQKKNYTYTYTYIIRLSKIIMVFTCRKIEYKGKWDMRWDAKKNAWVKNKNLLLNS